MTVLKYWKKSVTFSQYEKKVKKTGGRLTVELPGGLVFHGKDDAEFLDTKGLSTIHR